MINQHWVLSIEYIDALETLSLYSSQHDTNDIIMLLEEISKNLIVKFIY